MGILAADKAPYVIVLLLSLLGWHVAQLTDEIRSTRAVSYDVQTSDDEIRVKVHNVSRRQSVGNATFVIQCPREREICLAPGSGRAIIVPPTAVQATAIGNDGNYAEFRVTLAAGGSVEFRARREHGQSVPLFLFIPDSERPLDVYIYDANTVMGFLVANFTELVVASFLFFLVLLVAMVAGPSLVNGLAVLRKRVRK